MKGQGLDTPGEAADGGGQEAGLGGWASGKLSPRGWKPQRGGHGEARGRGGTLEGPPSPSPPWPSATAHLI